MVNEYRSKGATDAPQDGPKNKDNTMATKKKRLYGAIPYKVEKDTIWVLMVTSQTRKRWIFPNGNIEQGETGEQAGAREALEEAGIKGKIDRMHALDAVIGKSASDGIEDVNITFYPIEVVKELSKWDEMKERKRKWFRLDAAQAAVTDDDFGALLASISKKKFVSYLLAA